MNLRPVQHHLRQIGEELTELPLDDLIERWRDVACPTPDPEPRVESEVVDLLTWLLDARSIAAADFRMVREGRDLPASSFSNGPDVDPRRVRQLVREGCTIVVNRYERYDRHADRRRRSLADEYQLPTTISFFVTPPGNAGLVPHWDGQHVLVQQLVGSKEWDLWAPENAISDECVPRPALMGTEPERRVKVSHGQVMFVPRGVIHRCTASEQLSVHATYVLDNVSLRDVAAAAITSRLDRPELTRLVEPDWATNGLGPSSVELVSRITGIDAEDVARAARRIAREHYWDAESGMGVLRRMQSTIDESTRLVVNPASRVVVDQHNDVWADGSQVSVSPAVIQFLTACDAAPTAYADASTDPTDRESIRSLVDLGVLVVQEASC